MSTPSQPPDWSDLLELMTDRFGRLSEQALENLELLLTSGRHCVGSAETALMVPDDDGGHLRFLVSVNSRPGVSDIVRNIRVPTDRSIAGCVFSTGQLIAVAEPGEAQFYPEVDERTGLTTRMYLATPIVSQEDVLGVLTFMNRPDDSDTPFNQEEIEWSVRLAHLAATGLRYYQRLCLQNRLLRQDLAVAAERFGGNSGPTILDDGPVDDDGDHSPLARAMLALERLSENEQDLAADLLDVLSSHLETLETT